MQPIAPQNKILDSSGVTLVEVMISLVVLLIVFLGLIQASIVTIDHNLRNELRDEAVRTASDAMSRLRTTDFGDALLNDTAGESVVAFPFDETPNPVRNFRNAAVTFSIDKIITDLPDLVGTVNAKQVTIIVTWEWKDRTVAAGNPYTHTISSIVRR
ncbi:MAG: prepilin-type N-terminal cleavage/methylation domain-containing protein [Nitrospirota bacterium]|nr:prepilin-type N-terminal cleavage/methylation domain-containing protein [Nitrospirota bacterium]